MSVSDGEVKLSDEEVSLTDEENDIVHELKGSFEKMRYMHRKTWGLISMGTKSRTSERVAIKSYRKNYHDYHKEFKTEKSILNYLTEDGGSSKRIIKLIEIVDDNKYSHIILEWCVKDLFDHMYHVNGKLIYQLDKGDKNSHSLVFEHREAVRKIAIEIIDAVAWLHYKGICHCDLSLENVMMHEDGHIRIIDFGVSMKFDPKKFDEKWPKDKRKVGKTKYTSFECFDNREVDPRDNDMWSIGVMIWNMLIWLPPWSLPDHDDIQFYVIFNEGIVGIKKVLASFRRKCRKEKKISQLPRFRLNKKWRDFFAKIFCHEKHRLTMDQAKEHPLYTGRNNEPAPIMSPKKRAEEPDLEIESAIHKSRYDIGPHKIHESWDSLKHQEKQFMISWLAKREKKYADQKRDVTLLDRRLLERFTTKFNLEFEVARSIILHNWFLSDKSHHPHLSDHPYFQRYETKEEVKIYQTPATKRYLRWFYKFSSDERKSIKDTLTKCKVRRAFNSLSFRYEDLPVRNMRDFKDFREAIRSNQ